MFPSWLKDLSSTQKCTANWKLKIKFWIKNVIHLRVIRLFNWNVIILTKTFCNLNHYFIIIYIQGITFLNVIQYKDAKTTKVWKLPKNLWKKFVKVSRAFILKNIWDHSYCISIPRRALEGKVETKMSRKLACRLFSIQEAKNCIHFSFEMYSNSIYFSKKIQILFKASV